MSKKIMKKSLALGALMAFVITGSVWAANISDITEDVQVVHGIGNYDGTGNTNANASMDKSWTLGNKTLWIDEHSGNKAGWGTYAVAADYYSFVGDENSTLKVVGANDTNLTNGLAIAGNINVGNLNIDVSTYGIRSYGNTTVTANNIVIDAGYIALQAAEGGNIKVKAKESLNINGKGAAVFAQGAYDVIEIASYDGNKADIIVVGDIYSNGKVDLKLETKDSSLVGAAVMSENAQINVTLGNGATWNLTDGSTVSGIVVNGGANIDGGGNTLTLNKTITGGTQYAIEHKSGVLNVSNLVLSDIKKSANTKNVGAVLDAVGGTVNLNKVVIKDNSNTGNNGDAVVCMRNGANSEIVDSTFENNTGGRKGGAIQINGGTHTITSSTFKNNTAVNDKGGAITVTNATLNLTGGILGNTFVGNKVDGWEWGGALNVDGNNDLKSYINMTGNNTFDGNKARNGGVFGSKYAYELNVDSSNVENGKVVFKNNIATNNGGVIYTESDSKFYLERTLNFNNGGVDFTNNTANNGSAAYIDKNTTMNFNGATVLFENNTAKNNGGAIYSNGVVNFNKGKVTFAGNTAKGEANDIYNVGTININQGATVKLDGGITGTGTTNIKGGTLELAGGVTNINKLGGEKGVIHFSSADAQLAVVENTNETLKFTATSAVNEAVAGDANALVSEVDWAADTTMVMEAGDIVGEVTAELGENKDTGKLIVKSQTEAANPANQAISDAGVGLKLHYRYHMNDMNKRMGELRNANGEHGVWTRMVRGECEYENSKAQYNQYQLGYDEKLSVDKRWTVGAAVTFSEGDSSYGYGSTEDKSTAFAIYGSKLNDDGTFVDLIARYAHLESDIEDKAGKGDYSTNGMSVSAEFGKRIQQGNGLWIEPQFELTYGNFDSAEFQIGGKTVQVGDMDSLIGRIGFSLGKDIKQGNVYARASYLYDFDGETETAFSNTSATRTFKDDLGGGWWEVGVGANINLSKATYIYADVEKTFGGEVDTNWQWNLGVRYSF